MHLDYLNDWQRVIVPGGLVFFRAPALYGALTVSVWPQAGRLQGCLTMACACGGNASVLYRTVVFLPLRYLWIHETDHYLILALGLRFSLSRSPVGG